jgi:hypothetical protein
VYYLCLIVAKNDLKEPQEIKDIEEIKYLYRIVTGKIQYSAPKATF